MLRPLLIATAALTIYWLPPIQASPTIEGLTINLPDDGWYQVQDSENFAQVCAGVRSCKIAPGNYIVINHTTGERFENVRVNEPTEPTKPLGNTDVVVTDNVISWPDDGWYQVQNATTYESVCQGGRTCVVDAGQFTVINLTSGKRWENILVGDTSTQPPAGGTAVATNLRFTRYSSSAIELFWSHPASGTPSGGYSIYQDGVLIKKTTGQSYFISNLSDDQSYAFDVRQLGATSTGTAINVPAAISDSTPDLNPEPTPEPTSVSSLRELIPDTEILFGQPIDEIPFPVATGEDSVVPDWKYDIVNDQLSNDNYEAPLSHLATWESYSSLIPQQYRESMTAAVFLHSSSGDCARGIIAALGYSALSNTTPGQAKTTLYVCEKLTAEIYSGSFENPYRFNSTWVHETGHLLEANFTVDLSVPNGNFYDTKMYGSDFPTGPHLIKDSYVGQYFKEFWVGDIADFYKARTSENDNQWRLYEQFPNSFVSPYAATNFSEDFASSFEQFVMLDYMPVDNGNMTPQKILFFWNLPELVLMRDDIRSRF